MGQRIFFASRLDRDAFFNKSLASFSLKSWIEFCVLHGVRRQTLDRYRSGKQTLPEEVYDRFARNLSRKEKEYFSKKAKTLSSNWGAIKGGKEAYKTNKKAFERGRKLGLQKFSESRRKGFDYMAIDMDRNLAYIIGLWIGDGFSSGYQRHYITQFVGHKEELGYYEKNVCAYLKGTFNLEPKIKKSQIHNFIRVNIYSKDFFNLLVKKFGLPAGRKSRIVMIPEVIMSSSKEVLLSCVAGIYDAEGNVFLDKRAAYKQPYPRVGLHMINPGIMNQIKNILDAEGILTSWASVSEEGTRFLIYGKESIKKFLEKIPIKNPKHLDKLKSLGL